MYIIILFESFILGFYQILMLQKDQKNILNVYLTLNYCGRIKNKLQ
jgi:hypothetical protein